MKIKTVNFLITDYIPYTSLMVQKWADYVFDKIKNLVNAVMKDKLIFCYINFLILSGLKNHVCAYCSI